MSNTITDLEPDLFAAADIVGRELTGFISAVTFNPTAEQAAVGEVVRIPQTRSQSLIDITPSQTVPDVGDQTIDNATVTITKAKAVPIKWEGEQQKGFSNNGTYPSVFSQQAAQAMRSLANALEVDVASEYVRASRAYGTAGTTPFASTLTDTAQARKILADNGSPMSDMQLVIDTAAGANLRTLTQLTKANEAGTDDPLRRGVLLDVHGFAIRESAGIGLHTAGTGASATTDATGYAVGATTITLASAGTGTILAGDVITFDGDDNKYVVTSGDADVSDGGTITIAEPGLRQAIGTSATTITVVESAANSYTPNLAFHRSAIQLLTRVPARPIGGDAADMVSIVTDPNSGLTFSVAHYKGYHQAEWFVELVWAVKLVKPEFSAILLG